jgi:hypothetical protein
MGLTDEDLKKYQLQKDLLTFFKRYIMITEIMDLLVIGKDLQ